MPKVTFIDFAGHVRLVDAEAGSSLMEAAVRHGVDGIDADCGGACACGTCRVYVPEEWRALIGPAGAMEGAMLEGLGDAGPGCRLSCQVCVTDAMDGLSVATPESQH